MRSQSNTVAIHEPFGSRSCRLTLDESLNFDKLSASHVLKVAEFTKRRSISPYVTRREQLDVLFGEIPVDVIHATGSDTANIS